MLTHFSTHQVSSYNEAINSEMPTLFVLKDVYGLDVTRALIWKEITKVIEFLNLGKSMNIEQVKVTTEYILEDFSNLNLSDFKLFFSKLRKGDYGKLFDRIDGQIIYQALKEYKFDRIESAEEMSIREAAKYKQEEKDTNLLTSQEYIDAIKAILSENKPKVNNLYQNGKIVDQIEEKPQTVEFKDRCFRQFNNLRRGNKFRRYDFESPIMMIQVGNLKPMSITEFLHYKLNG